MRSDYELLIVGDTQRADLSLNPPEYAVIAERSLREGLLVILAFSNYPDDERMEAMRAETLGSQPMSSRQACLKMARQSDIYLGIYRARCGWVPPGDQASVTEMELQEARERGKDILVSVTSLGAGLR